MRSTSNGREHLDIFGIAVKHRVREDHLVTDREAVMIPVLAQLTTQSSLSSPHTSASGTKYL